MHGDAYYIQCMVMSFFQSMRDNVHLYGAYLLIFVLQYESQCVVTGKAGPFFIDTISSSFDSACSPVPVTAR